MANTVKTNATNQDIDEDIKNSEEQQTEAKEKIFLFKDDNQYKDDLFVSVNGRNFQIKRGVEVEVPSCVAEVIRNSDKQRQLAEMRSEQLAKQYITSE